MQDKPLDQTEQDLLDVIRHLHAQTGPIPRNRLTVEGRGRGMEVARPLNRLKHLGLVEEFEQKPFFLSRLFGVKSITMVRPVDVDSAPSLVEEDEALIAPAADAGPDELVAPIQAAEASATPSYASPPATEPVLRNPIGPAPDWDPTLGEVPGPDADWQEPATEPFALESPEPEPFALQELRHTPFVFEADATAAAMPEAPELIAPQPVIAPIPAALPPIGAAETEVIAETAPSQLPQEVREEIGRALEALGAPEPATLADVQIEPPASPSDLADQAPAAEAAPAVEEVQAPTAQVLTAKPSQAEEYGAGNAPAAPEEFINPAATFARLRPLQLPPQEGYTDEIGGQPLIAQPYSKFTAPDREMIEGLREMLGVLGMELTMAGEVLIADRMASGASLGEAAMQVCVFAFAHAAHYEIGSRNPAPSEDLSDYGQAILADMEKLLAAGEISPGAFERDRPLILALADNSTDRSALVDDLFRDPIAGAAPPALLPEELRGIEVMEEEEEDRF